MLAAELKRAVVLPDWLLNGMQKADAKEVIADDGAAVPFGCACLPACMPACLPGNCLPA